MRHCLILALLCLVGWSSAQKCPAKYLRFTTKHSFCLSPNPTCQVSRTGVSQEDIEVILRVHNEFRSKVAMGNERGTLDHRQLPQAADMMQMEWDDELAAVAQKWTENCKWGHDCDECKAVENFVVGQNLAITNFGMCRGYGCQDPSNVPDWTGRITDLYNEVQDYHTNWLASYVPHDVPKKTGHFTQLIWSKSWKVGCGYSYYKQGGTFHKYYACNYGPGGNVRRQPVYIQGQPCTACPTNTQCSPSGRGANTFPGLCKMNNPYTSPVYRLNPQTTLFYCGASSSDPDCQFEKSGDGSVRTVDSVGGNYYSIVLNGGQSATITFNKLFKPHGGDFCLDLTFRKGPLDAIRGDASTLMINYKLDGGYYADPMNLGDATIPTTSFRKLGINLGWPSKTKISFTFSVPSGAGQHVMDLRKIFAHDGAC